MSAERLLETVGQALYGQQWQTALARDLNVAARTVRHWAQTGAVPNAKWEAIQNLCRARTHRLEMSIAALGYLLD